MMHMLAGKSLGFYRFMVANRPDDLQVFAVRQFNAVGQEATITPFHGPWMSSPSEAMPWKASRTGVRLMLSHLATSASRRCSPGPNFPDRMGLPHDAVSKIPERFAALLMPQMPAQKNEQGAPER